eukprot:MONOS_16730.1-p1 / transcript=MONOS_16730.1 / gene=MONOS_16730 / organism=Monocercomonoides_exilis_PA203 / gene_product=unspecified product / transcript_product=unspecified product / location=Mono_scaffold02095:734-2005(+) / protein_length=424 / sequence_SO=supercontig / SO=protein_coding / is_pseudo=false
MLPSLSSNEQAEMHSARDEEQKKALGWRRAAGMQRAREWRVRVMAEARKASCSAGARSNTESRAAWAAPCMVRDGSGCGAAGAAAGRRLSALVIVEPEAMVIVEGRWGRGANRVETMWSTVLHGASLNPHRLKSPPPAPSTKPSAVKLVQRYTTSGMQNELSVAHLSNPASLARSASSLCAPSECSLISASRSYPQTNRLDPFSAVQLANTTSPTTKSVAPSSASTYTPPPHPCSPSALFNAEHVSNPATLPSPSSPPASASVEPSTEKWLPDFISTQIPPPFAPLLQHSLRVHPATARLDPSASVHSMHPPFRLALSKLAKVLFWRSIAFAEAELSSGHARGAVGEDTVEFHTRKEPPFATSSSPHSAVVLTDSTLSLPMSPSAPAPATDISGWPASAIAEHTRFVASIFPSVTARGTNATE